jgi:hypothetical protein
MIRFLFSWLRQRQKPRSILPQSAEDQMMFERNRLARERRAAAARREQPEEN